jgi:uncharacterized membrane protein YgdD (TMEM256/DUF423 family)
MTRVWLATAGLGGAASVIAGALAAHLVDAPKTAALLHTGALYGMVHAAALLAVVALVRAGAAPRGATAVAGSSFALGIALFSFSLFGLAASGARSLGWLTPLGGIAFIIGWLALATLALHRR